MILKNRDSSAVKCGILRVSKVCQGTTIQAILHDPTLDHHVIIKLAKYRVFHVGSRSIYLNSSRSVAVVSPLHFACCTDWLRLVKMLLSSAEEMHHTLCVSGWAAPARQDTILTWL